MEIVVCATWNVWKERNDFNLKTKRPPWLDDVLDSEVIS
jgi:hypothetical protein